MSTDVRFCILKYVHVYLKILMNIYEVYLSTRRRAEVTRLRLSVDYPLHAEIVRTAAGDMADMAMAHLVG